MTRLRVGTRASSLAQKQTEAVVDLLRKAHPNADLEVVEITTQGDSDQDTPLNQGSNVGWFTSAIQQALLRNEIDVAVHSYKDLPTKRPDGLSIAAVPLREDPRDALVSLTRLRLGYLPEKARIGTSSPRREAQIRGIRPDVRVDSIRGNVETRIGKVKKGDYDAIVVAHAGIQRLGLQAEVAQVFGYEEMLPAPAQGALAVECRSEDSGTREMLEAIDDPELRPIVTAERVFLATLEAGCSFPAGAYAERFGSTVKLNAMVAPNGAVVRSKIGGPVETAAGLGKELAEELMRTAGMEPPAS
ncbi:MAG: hydroxymethylbilane synthase [Dehalococcoidia bacterium]|nr:hydroxymethylbilane synthase [Dehalococcoidia bacterium]